MGFFIFRFLVFFHPQVTYLPLWYTCFSTIKLVVPISIGFHCCCWCCRVAVNDVTAAVEIRSVLCYSHCALVILSHTHIRAHTSAQEYALC